MGHTFWAWRRSSPGQFEGVPARTVNRFLDGEAALPPNENGDVLLALAFITTQDRRAVEVWNVDFSRHRVLSNGFLDPEHRWATLRSAVDSLPPILSQERDGTVIHARHVFARAAHEHVGKWKPTSREVRLLAAAIDARAGYHVPWRVHR